MKVALISQPFDKVAPPNQNSIGILTYNLSNKLADYAEMIVYAGTKRRGLEWKTEAGVQYRFVATTSNRFIRKLNRSVYQPIFDKKRITGFDIEGFRYIFRIAADLRRQNCDIIHIHNFSQFVPILRFLNPKARIILHMHCEWLTQLDRRLIEGRLRHVDLIIGVSEYITGKIRSRFPHIASRCHTIYNGVDVDRFTPSSSQTTSPNKTRQILFVGRVSPEKGLHDLICAFQALADRFPEFGVRIVGSNKTLPKEFLVGLSEEADVANLAPYLQGNYQEQLFNSLPARFQNRLDFAGFISSELMPDQYRQASILVNPSYSESFGMSLIEAMSCEVPVVATRVGGMPEVVIEGETGILVERGNVDELSGAIAYLLENDDLRRTMGKKGRQQVLAHYSWEQISRDLLKCYRELS